LACLNADLVREGKCWSGSRTIKGQKLIRS
jgi:hypothetical protein